MCSVSLAATTTTTTTAILGDSGKTSDMQQFVTWFCIAKVGYLVCLDSTSIELRVFFCFLKVTRTVEVACGTVFCCGMLWWRMKTKEAMVCEISSSKSDSNAVDRFWSFVSLFASTVLTLQHVHLQFVAFVLKVDVWCFLFLHVALKKDYQIVNMVERCLTCWSKC